jgi:hypothetical protein
MLIWTFVGSGREAGGNLHAFGKCSSALLAGGRLFIASDRFGCGSPAQRHQYDHAFERHCASTERYPVARFYGMRRSNTLSIEMGATARDGVGGCGA